MTQNPHIRAIATLCGLVAVLAPALSYADETIDFSASHTSGQSFGRDSGNVEQVAQAFTPSADAITATFTGGLGRTAAGALFNIDVSIQADSAGVPSGTPLGTVAYDESVLPISDSDCSGGSGGNWQTVTFDTISGLTLSASTQYWLVLDTDFHQAYAAGVPFMCHGTYAGSVYKYFASAAWSDGANGMYGSLALTSSGGGGSATTTQTATSTVDQTQQNVWQAYWVLFSMLVFVVWLGRSRSQ